MGDINEFGQEQTDHISDVDMMEVLQSNYNVIEMYYAKLYDNPKNRNVHMFSLKNKCVQVWKDRKWELIPFDVVIDDIILICVRLIRKYMEIKKVNNKIYNKMEDILDHCLISDHIQNKISPKLIKIVRGDSICRSTSF